MPKKVSVEDLAKCTNVSIMKGYYVHHAFSPPILEVNQANIDLDPAKDAKSEMCLPSDQVEALKKAAEEQAKAAAATKPPATMPDSVLEYACRNCHSDRDCNRCPYIAFID